MVKVRRGARAFVEPEFEDSEEEEEDIILKKSKQPRLFELPESEKKELMRQAYLEFVQKMGSRERADSPERRGQRWPGRRFGWGDLIGRWTGAHYWHSSIAISYYGKALTRGQRPIQSFEMLELYFWEHMLWECCGDKQYPSLKRPQSGMLQFDFDKISWQAGNDIEVGHIWPLKKFNDGEFDAVQSSSSSGSDTDKSKYSDSESVQSEESQGNWHAPFHLVSVVVFSFYCCLASYTATLTL